MKFNRETPLQQVERERRQSAPLNGNDGFSLLKQEPTRIKGYDIRFQTTEDCWLRRQAHGWAKDGEMPAEWLAIVNDPTTVKAVMFPSSQRTWRADRRRNVATYDRAMVEALAAL